MRDARHGILDISPAMRARDKGEPEPGKRAMRLEVAFYGGEEGRGGVVTSTTNCAKVAKCQRWRSLPGTKDDARYVALHERARADVVFHDSAQKDRFLRIDYIYIRNV